MNKLAMAVQYASAAQDLPTAAQFRKWARLALRADAEIALRVVDEDEGRMLNRDYRGKDYATNVLSFPAHDTALGHLGDIALAYGVCAREAVEQGKTLSAHLQHLVAHGVLHLVGYDHEDEADAEVMEDLERQILAGLGLADPYLERQGS